MMTHSDIVKRIGCERLATERGVSIHTTRSWAQRNSIPAEHWASLVEAGLATYEELGSAAASAKAAA